MATRPEVDLTALDCIDCLDNHINSTIFMPLIQSRHRAIFGARLVLSQLSLLLPSSHHAFHSASWSVPIWMVGHNAGWEPGATKEIQRISGFWNRISCLSDDVTATPKGLCFIFQEPWGITRIQPHLSPDCKLWVPLSPSIRWTSGNERPAGSSNGSAVQIGECPSGHQTTEFDFIVGGKSPAQMKWLFRTRNYSWQGICIFLASR